MTRSVGYWLKTAVIGLSCVYWLTKLIELPCLVNGEDSDQVFDYIIIGGGIAGLTQMEMIDYNDKDASKLLIEQYDRVGGRAFSLNLTYLGKSITFEHGGTMRHRWNDWPYKLNNYLGLCDNLVLMDGTTDDSRQEKLFRNIRRENVPIADLRLDEYFELVYNYREETDFNVPNWGTIANQVYDENNGGNAPTTEAEMHDCLENWTYKGYKFTEWTPYAIWKTVFNVSVEYINRQFNNQYPTTFDGVDPIGGQCRYNSIVQWLSARPSDVAGGAHTLVNGWNLMSQTLYERLDENENNEFHFNEELMSIEYTSNDNNNGNSNNNKKYTITTRNFDDYSQVSTYYADNVVLSIPPKNLEKIKDNIEPFCQIKDKKNGICYKRKDVINELVYESKASVEWIYKVNLIYDNYWDWVEQTNVTDYIQSITDLDIRSFYIDDSWRDDNLFAIQFYSRSVQAQRLHFLQQSVNSELYEFDENVIVSHYNDNRNVKYTAASKLLVNSVIKEMADLLSLSYDDALINRPIAAFAQSFGLNDTGMDSLYRWKNGVNYVKTIDNILQPLSDENIYIVSGDYSRLWADDGGAIYAAAQNTVNNLKMFNPLENVTHCSTL